MHRGGRKIQPGGKGRIHKKKAQIGKERQVGNIFGGESVYREGEKKDF